MARTIQTLYKRIGVKEIGNGKIEFVKPEKVYAASGKPAEPFNISKRNRQLLYDHDQKLKAKGRKYPSRARPFFVIAHLCEHIKKPIDKMTKEDIRNFVNWLEDKKDYQNNTKATYKQTVRAFFREFYETKHYPEIVDFIEINRKQRKLKPEEIITVEEFQKMVDACVNPKDKAILGVLWETGAREGELVSCRIKNLKFFPEGYAVLYFPEEGSPAKTGVAKTGSYHSAPIIETLPLLNNHLNHHPDKDNPEAPLFYSNMYRDFGKPLESSGIYLIVKILAKRAGIQKRVYPHLFRHTRNTIWAKQGYTAEEINLMSGRSQGSPAAQIYIHLNRDHTRKKVLQRHGLVEKDNGEHVVSFENTRCWNCKEKNAKTNLLCQNDACNMPLKLKDEEKQRFERMRDALMVYETMEKASEVDPKMISGMLEGILQKLKDRKNKNL